MDTELNQVEADDSENEDSKHPEYTSRPRAKKFTCSFCNKVLSSKQNLKEHEFTHTGELPYVCKYPGCGMRFRQGSVLSSHKRIHSFIEKYIAQDSYTFIKVTPIQLTDMLKKFKQETIKYNEDYEEKVELPPISEPQEFCIVRDYED